MKYWSEILMQNFGLRLYLNLNTSKFKYHNTISILDFLDVHKGSNCLEAYVKGMDDAYFLLSSPIKRHRGS